MKKKIITLLAIVTIITTMCACFVGCNKKNDTEKASNSETLGTAIAVAVGNAASANASAAEGETEDNEGINIDFSGSVDINLAFNSIAKPLIDEVVKTWIDSSDHFINSSNISVEKVESDNEAYAALYNLTITYQDKDSEEASTVVYKLYIDAKKADGTTADVDKDNDYTFDAKMVIDNFSISVSGKATYSEEKGTAVFSVSIGEEFGSIDISFWANEGGFITLAYESNIADVSLKTTVNVGHFDENKYGIDIVVDLAITKSVTPLTLKVDVDVTANKTESSHDFLVSGSAQININNNTISANLTGTATYDAEDNLIVSISGKASIN